MLKCDLTHKVFDACYDSKGRFNSYYAQIKEVLDLKPKSILEVGVGTSFTCSYLRRFGFQVFTIDILKELGTDLIGSVNLLPLKNECVDVSICFEVLEHLPYFYFEKALLEINRICKSYAVISLPDSSYYLGFSIKFPLTIPSPLFSFPKTIHRKLDSGSAHHWEIGRNGYPLHKIKDDIKKSGFSIKKTYRVFENPFHRMFLLKKITET